MGRSLGACLCVDMESGDIETGDLGRGSALNLELVVAADTTMPRGHDWAVMTLPKEVVVILVRESAMRRTGLDPCVVNEALRQAG